MVEGRSGDERRPPTGGHHLSSSRQARAKALVQPFLNTDLIDLRAFSSRSRCITARTVAPSRKSPQSKRTASTLGDQRSFEMTMEVGTRRRLRGHAELVSQPTPSWMFEVAETIVQSSRGPDSVA